MKNVNPILARCVALGAIGSAVMAPMTAHAQSLGDLDRLINRRQSKKNEWRNIGYGSAALGIYGLLKKDNTLFFAGTAGALYSAHRYEQDRKSQSKLARARASYFSRGYINRDGQRYVRKTTYKNGKKYYYFARA
jgi:hypothetical protein